MGAVGEMVWTAERMFQQARSLIPNEEGNVELGENISYRLLYFGLDTGPPGVWCFQGIFSVLAFLFLNCPLPILLFSGEGFTNNPFQATSKLY
jgi:hypothetical protein